MLKKITKKGIAILLIILSLFSVFSNAVFAATEINAALIKYGGDCGYHLQYWDSSNNRWSYIITSYVFYEENGVQYPAYCLDASKPGAEQGEYTVNVDEVINDVRLWRVAINGYPYQSPQSIGVENQYDAFVATKQAIYSILDGRDVNSFYNGADARGQAIKNAIINLVNIGRNGTQTPGNTDVVANKVGEFTEDGDYYYQEYSINSPVETSQYTITATKDYLKEAKLLICLMESKQLLVEVNILK